ncbi:membrane hypothetical protein [Thiocapsa sp. KS1]|nr:hypothetical protein [Thiocapsa sp. KS1]CRI64573.1 membrane hypothetical protein [Thiocapsa sp. KS1]
MKMFQKTSILILTVVGLTTGASVAPAAIVYDDFGGTPKSYTFGTTAVTFGELLTLDLPGEANVILAQTFSSPRNFFQIYSSTMSGAVFQRTVVGSLFYTYALAVGETWDDGVSDTGVVVGGFGGNITSLATGSSGNAIYLRTDPTYIPFRFVDTSDNGTKYGYIETFTNLTGTGIDAEVTWTVNGYAYETEAGKQIAMGAREVSEPAPIPVLSAPGLLTLLAGLLGLGGFYARRRR